MVKWIQYFPVCHRKHGNDNVLERIMLLVLCVLFIFGSASAQSICDGHKTVFSTVLNGSISDGPADYLSNQRCEWLILSPDPVKYPYITLEFLFRLTECAYDYIMVLDGDSYDSPVLATLSGDSTTTMWSPNIVLAQSGKMLVYLFRRYSIQQTNDVNDMNTEFAGFNASFTISECPNNCTGNGQCADNKCTCDTAWTATDCSQHACLHNCGARQKHGHCRTEVKKCYCEDGHIGQGCHLNIYSDVQEGSWSVVYDYPDEPGSMGRAGHTGIYLDPYFYIFGGFDGNKPLAELLRYDFQQNEWQPVEHSQSQQPSARFFHSMTTVTGDRHPTHFLVVGGDVGSDQLSNETWMYDTSSDSWRLHVPSKLHDSIPAICQHTATFVETIDGQYIYLFGGRTQNSHEFGLSSDMYRFDWMNERWQKMIYDPSGVKASKLRVAGHSMVYDAVDGSLILFGGFRMDSQHKAVYSSSVFVYSVKANRWAEIAASDDPESFTYNVEPMAFHSANVIGDYMVVHGGSLLSHNHNLCYSWKTHFYNMRCHSWIKELSEPAPIRSFGHAAAVINEAVLLIHGGYNGAMSRRLLALKLPKLNTVVSSEVASMACEEHGGNEDSCAADYLHGCVYINRQCKSSENELPTCGSICQYLKDCQSCATFQSYVRNSAYDWESSHCGWCAQDSKCYSVNNNEENFGACVGNVSISKQVRWWNASDTKLLQNPEQCLLHNIQPGVIASEYHNTPNFSQPDNVSHLTEVNLAFDDQGLFGDCFVKINGFFRPKKIQKNFLKMKLHSSKGNSAIQLSSNDSPVVLTEIAKTQQTNQLVASMSGPLALHDFNDERYYIQITYNHTGSDEWMGKVEAEIATSDTTAKDDFKFFQLSSTFLEPYQSFVITDANVPSCSALSNCLSCLTDASCTWCQPRSLCVPKTVAADRSEPCGSVDLLTYSPHFGMITEPESCVMCQDYSTCYECVTASTHCEWRRSGDVKGEERCVRRGSGGNSTSVPAECPLPCHHRQDCQSCLEKTNQYEIALNCAWCSTTQKCYLFTRYHLTAYLFGQCAFWVDKQENCTVCSKQQSCQSCLQTYECGWCSASSNPLLGYCTRGGFTDSQLKCDAEYLPSEYSNNETEDILWNYSSCPDVNECELQEWPKENRLHSCHANATCHNTDGSYICICKNGFEGDGHYCNRTCVTTCEHGKCSGPPLYKCICDLGWTSSISRVEEGGIECDVGCNCNLLSTCNSGQGICDSCQHNTTGPTCEQCLPGHYHGIGVGIGCHPCQCNGHGVPDMGLCNQTSGECFCQDNTEGAHCEMCNKSGYFGYPRNGGTCYRKCEGRLRLYDDFGAFGSWETAIRQDGSMLRREIENKISTKISVANCEWTVIAQNFTYGKTAIKIILEKNIKMPCYTNKVLVFDGDFQSDGMTLLGEFCGSNWENDGTVLSTKGRVTVQYTDVYLEDKPRNSGFKARYEVVTLCENETWSSDDIFSGDDGEEPLITGYYNSSVLSTATENCPNQFYGLMGGCPNDCFSQLGQGVCKNGYCHCSENFTGFDCSKNKTEFAASISVDVEWNKFLNGRPQPSARIGHALLSIGQSLWLHGGISYNEGPLSDLWRYNTNDREWTVFNMMDDFPERRFMHAAAKHPSGKRFYIHGGILNGGNTSSDIWLFSDDELWKKLDTDISLPSLTGHTMTFCGGNVAYIIGGYSSSHGFSKNVWTFDATSKLVEFIPKSQIHPPMIYGHSAVCDQDTGMIYVFGGMEASLLQYPSPTNFTYVLNTTTLEWQPVFLNGSDPIVPSPRAFHVALNYWSVSTKGMMVIGGQIKSSETSDEIWFLDYKCGKWIKLASGENIPAYAALASVNGNHYIYGGLQNGRFEDQMIVVSVVGSFHDDFTENCDGEAEVICSYFKDCKHCLGADSCHWCKPSSDLEKGKCLSLSYPCDADHGAVSDKNECNLCLNRPSSMCNTRPDCSWRYTEVMDKDHDKLLRSCLCRWESSVTDFAYTTAAQSNAPVGPAAPLICEDCSHECPGSCSVQKSCETCLEFPDSTGVWWFCIWSPALQKCLDPAYVPLVCPPGGNCGTLASKGKASCPVSRCNELSSCWKCINEPLCYWLQLDSTGLCQDVSEREDSGDSWYYECPAEDECSNLWDDCLNDKTNFEKCLDLPQGYKCECQKGYDRAFSTRPCTPVCTEGCDHGTCKEPDTCSCNFGYTGVNCTVACQCNGHSDCMDEKRPHICLKCHHNTVGNQCESCKTGFVGDPTKYEQKCEKCKDVCHEKSKVCTSTIKNTTSHGPTHDDVRCVNCSGHSWGDRCEKCKEGYFKSTDGKCHKCDCNGHSDTCDQATGGLCKCQNETTSSEEKCNAPQPNQDHPSDCWKKQCDKCRPMYQGNPRDGGHCYRHVTIEQGMCFSAKSPTLCPTVDYGGPTKNYLPAGETVSFAINPKYTNVDIRIIVDVTYGELSLFLSHMSDSFRIITDKLTYMHKVIPNGEIVNIGRKKRDLTHQTWHSDYLGDRSQDEEVVRMQRSYLSEDDWRVEQDDSRSIFAESPLRSSKLKLNVVNASDINSYVSLRPNTALRVDGIQNRLVVTVPYRGFDLKLTKFFVILLGQRAVQPILLDAAPVTDNLNNKRTIRNVKNQVVDRTAGQLVFRQDQTHIDLFVFFSVFFSCFFLFLAICIVAWKIKQAMDARRTIQEHKIQMQHMASRPFATVYVILDNYIPDPLFYSRKCKRSSDRALPHVAMNSTAMLFQARSCPIFDRHGNQEPNNDGPGTSGLNAATLRPSSSSLPTSPTRKTFRAKQNVGTYSRGTDNRNLTDLTPNLSKGEHVSPVMSISKSISQGTCYSYDSTERLLVLHASSDTSATKIPLLNSTTTYIKQEPEAENFCQLTPLSSDGSRSPSPFRPRVQTIVSLDESGKIRTFGKRRTLPPVLNESDASAERIFEPRIKFRSTPHIPVTQPRNLVTDNISQPILNIKSSMESPRHRDSSGSQKHSLMKLPHRVSAKSSIKTDSRSTCATGKAIRPLACEITENGFASVNTVLLQLPGGSKAPVLACLGSTLATTHNSCYPSLSNDLHVSMPQFKSRYSKVS